MTPVYQQIALVVVCLYKCDRFVYDGQLYGCQYLVLQTIYNSNCRFCQYWLMGMSKRVNQLWNSTSLWLVDTHYMSIWKWMAKNCYSNFHIMPNYFQNNLNHSLCTQQFDSEFWCWTGATSECPATHRKVQNMDPWSIHPLRGHGPPIFLPLKIL